jgi:hypothetical protein
MITHPEFACLSMPLQIPNLSLGADSQQENAALRLVLPAGQLER